jgi:hypothetical protein
MNESSLDTATSNTEFNPLVSITDNANAQPARTLPVKEIPNWLRTGSHRPQVAKIKKTFAKVLAETGDVKAAKKAIDADKKKLPGIMAGGVFTARGDKNLETYSQVLCGDVDNLTAERVGIVYDQLATDPHCIMAMVSPSGFGVKFLCRTIGNADQHGQSVAAMAKHFLDTYRIEIDPACKNLERLCFAPDNASEWNHDAVPFAPLPIEPKAERVKMLAAPSSNHPPTRTQIAEKLLGVIQWTDEGGFCKCPGEHLHTTANAAKDCKVMLDGVPTIKCFHGSCAGIVGGVNHELRSQIAKAEFVPTRTPQAAPDSNRADIASEYLGEEIEQGDASEKKNGFTIRTPDEILAMQFDDSDRMLGDHLLDDGGQLALLGAGGVGKSRLLLLLLACIAGARRFLTFDTFKPEMKWLVLQTENSNRRLQQDLAPIKSWLGDGWARFTERVTIHTVETDSDAFVNLDDPDAVARIEAAIQKHKPDGIAIDPLADFAAGDLNKDADMKATLQVLSRVCRRGNPKRAIIVLHHAITGRGGAAKATGYDRASFARNSKMLHAWARGQINLAPVDPDSNDRLIIACGKCSNGREFQTFAVRLNPDTMIYECDPTVDVSQWERDITGTKDNAPLMNPDRVRELCAVTGSSKAALAKSIMDDCGCYRGSAYRYITRAEQSKKITFNKSHETYFRK